LQVMLAFSAHSEISTQVLSQHFLFIHLQIILSESIPLL